jgi:hypothetical protein
MASARTWESELSKVDAVIELDGRALRLLLEDARSLARAEARHAHATRGQAPALASALSQRAGDELEEIAQALEQAHNAYLLEVDPTDAELVPRAHFVVAEITSALEFLLVHDRAAAPSLAQLQRLADMHKADPDTGFALAIKLIDYANLARPHRDALERLGGFDIGLIDEARDLAQELRERGPAGERTPAARAALQTRNRLATLLQRKVTAIRSAARFVFRNQPDVLRDFSGPVK